MLGFRGASRYIAETFRDCFPNLNVAAMKPSVREMGLTNVQLMVPSSAPWAKVRRRRTAGRARPQGKTRMS